jgi:uncharacterized cupin superfamily protein
MREARLEETPYGRYVTSEGWFVLNLEDALAVREGEDGHAIYPLEGREAPFEHFGVNVRVLRPGEANGKYHSESGQEAFLVLHGECTLLVEEEERTLRQWDFFHCPPGTSHIFVGAGEAPCAILMIGLRPEDEALHYPVSELAAKYGASVQKATDDPDEAYADRTGDYVPLRLPFPPRTGPDAT